ncbi:disease resistance protein [Striga asiatica]|uniref:Disease resistance protein n=1 Tax=Striga asiatica TaxID=4170 RepID=A0A5A7R5X2_STRAF|nr:disease resistance protein [Striga asiatica]
MELLVCCPKPLSPPEDEGSISAPRLLPARQTAYAHSAPNAKPSDSNAFGTHSHPCPQQHHPSPHPPRTSRPGYKAHQSGGSRLSRPTRPGTPWTRSAGCTTYYSNGPESGLTAHTVTQHPALGLLHFPKLRLQVNVHEVKQFLVLVLRPVPFLAVDQSYPQPGVTHMSLVLAELVSQLLPLATVLLIELEDLLVLFLSPFAILRPVE